MDWRKYIVSDENALLGKPTIKGTRNLIAQVIGLLSQGWTEQQILAKYPRLSSELFQAVFSYTNDCIKDGPFVSSS